MLLNKWLIWRLFSICCISKRFFSKLFIVLLSMPPHIKIIYMQEGSESTILLDFKILSSIYETFHISLHILLMKKSLYHSIFLTTTCMQCVPIFSKGSVSESEELSFQFINLKFWYVLKKCLNYLLHINYSIFLTLSIVKWGKTVTCLRSY